ENERAGWCGCAGVGRADPLAKHPQGDIALLGPVFVAPDLAAFRRNGGCGLRGDRGGYAKAKPTNTYAPEKRASCQRISGLRHVSSPRHVLARVNSNSGPDGLK